MQTGSVNISVALSLPMIMSYYFPQTLSIVGVTTGSVDSLATLTGASVTRGGSIISSEG